MACLDMMARVVAALQERARRCREVAGYLGGLSSGSPALQAAYYHLDAAASECEKAAHFAERAFHDARGWAASMVGGESGGPASGRRGAAGPVGGLGERAGGPQGEGSKPPQPADKDEPDPKAQAIIRRLPVREDNTGKTRGLWIGRDGTESPLVSGYDRYQELADRYADERLGLGPLANATHVEIKFALFMRERGLRNETIYLNNDPCKGPASCRRWLGSFLPPGAKLTIHWPDSAPEIFEGKS